MSSYITQLEILRDDNREQLQNRVDYFCIDKCVKKTQFYIKESKIDGIAKHEAYIYYTIPSPPIITVTYINLSITSITIGGSCTSPIYSEIKRLGICYNTTGNPTVNDTYINMPLVWDDFSITIPNLSQGTTYYLKVFIETCIGITYSGLITEVPDDYLLDVHGELVIDLYSNYILTL